MSQIETATNPQTTEHFLRGQSFALLQDDRLFRILSCLSFKTYQGVASILEIHEM